MVSPQHYAAEINATKTAIETACTWSSVGATVLAKREMDEATRTAQKAAARAGARRGAKPATPEHTDPAEALAPYEPPPSTPWGWILGAGALGLTAAAFLLRKQPAVVRVVRKVRR
jgi:hypothetical protein